MHGATNIGAVGKAAALLRLIAADRGRTRATAFAEPLGLPPSTLHRHIYTLEDHGLIVRLGNGRYGLGLLLIEAGADLSVTKQLAAVAKPLLVNLARASKATAHLGVFENEMVTYLVKAPHRRSTLSSFIGETQQLEAYCTGIGKVLLAFLPQESRAAYLRNGSFVALTPTTLSDPAELESCLNSITGRGWGYDNEEMRPGLYCLSVPVRQSSSHVAAAISLSFDISNYSPSREAHLVEMLHSCAEQIERRCSF